jgi:hypothetical protein
VKPYQEELQRRIQELIQDFELKTDWRVEIVAFRRGLDGSGILVM